MGGWVEGGLYVVEATRRLCVCARHGRARWDHDWCSLKPASRATQQCSPPRPPVLKPMPSAIGRAALAIAAGAGIMRETDPTMGAAIAAMLGAPTAPPNAGPPRAYIGRGQPPGGACDRQARGGASSGWPARAGRAPAARWWQRGARALWGGGRGAPAQRRGAGRVRAAHRRRRRTIPCSRCCPSPPPPLHPTCWPLGRPHPALGNRGYVDNTARGGCGRRRAPCPGREGSPPWGGGARAAGRGCAGLAEQLPREAALPGGDVARACGVRVRAPAAGAKLAGCNACGGRFGGQGEGRCGGARVSPQHPRAPARCVRTSARVSALAPCTCRLGRRGLSQVPHNILLLAATARKRVRLALTCFDLGLRVWGQSSG